MSDLDEVTKSLDEVDRLFNRLRKDLESVTREQKALHLVLLAIIRGDLVFSRGDPMPWRIRDGQYETLIEAFSDTKYASEAWKEVGEIVQNILFPPPRSTVS